MALIDSIINVESGGNPNARNPHSSASGAGQFIDSTWISMIRQHRPDLAQSMSNSDLLALKSDPQLSREMTAAYAADNDASGNTPAVRQAVADILMTRGSNVNAAQFERMLNETVQRIQRVQQIARSIGRGAAGGLAVTGPGQRRVQ